MTFHKCSTITRSIRTPHVREGRPGRLLLTDRRSGSHGRAMDPPDPTAENERWFPSQPEENRSEVEKDRDRIVHSSAFRRLQGKSQVFGAEMTDYFRNRLTHSVECAQIGRAIAQRADASDWQSAALSLEDFATSVEAACLAHDIGHPPFGHNGEEALSEALAQHLDGHLFEGNAHSFRIVTYVEKPPRAAAALLQSPLTDSNRRPPPYHPERVATGRNQWQRIGT
jgi:dGTP triphosphohydrolase